MNILDIFRRRRNLEEEVFPCGQCNISPETNEWNTLALQMVEEQRENYFPKVSLEEVRKRQEETYRWNDMALAYVRGRA